MDVAAWLKHLNLGKYEAAFRENEIDETVLPNLTAEDLPFTGIIECACTPGAICNDESALMNRLEESMLSSAVGITNGVPIMLDSRSFPSWTADFARPPGRLMNLFPNLTMGLLAI